MTTMNEIGDCIVLLNGQKLVCYPIAADVQPPASNELSSETTREHPVNDSASKEEGVGETERRDEGKVFLENAFLFFHNAHRIMSDSRMFLAPVPFQSGLAYMGTSGFRRPTLGVYLEWWLNSEADVTKDGEGRVALVYRMAGSPLSGMNRCSCVYPDGSTKAFSLSSFNSAAGLFRKINNRYVEAKGKYEAYSLAEVVDILKSADSTKEDELANQVLLEQSRTYKANSRCVRLMRNYKTLEEEYRSLQDEYYQLAVLHFKKELDAFRDEYIVREKAVDAEIREMSEKRAAFKSQMKRGEITNVEYQHLFMPLDRRKKNIERELWFFKFDSVRELTKSFRIAAWVIERYLLEGKENS